MNEVKNVCKVRPVMLTDAKVKCLQRVRWSEFVNHGVYVESMTKHVSRRELLEKWILVRPQPMTNCVLFAMLESQK